MLPKLQQFLGGAESISKSHPAKAKLVCPHFLCGYVPTQTSSVGRVFHANVANDLAGPLLSSFLHSSAAMTSGVPAGCTKPDFKESLSGRDCQEDQGVQLVLCVPRHQTGGRAQG